MNQVNIIIGKFDCFRASCLSPVLKIQFIRELYRNCATRLAMGYVLTIAIYLPLSLIRPDIVLLSGPLVFGYPHLIASFRYVQKRSATIFALLTLICILGHLTGFGLSIIRELPFGVWQMYVAMAGLLITNHLTRTFSYKQVLLSLFICCGLIYLAHLEPVIFIGGMLILHNWVGYFFWIIASKGRSRRTVVILALITFFIIHLLVLKGHLDSYFPVSQNQMAFPGETRTTGWYLASWTNEPLVWYRFLVLYAFGLSMHYFVWLRAVPQSLNPIEHPNSFRLSLKYLREDIGTKFLFIMGLVSVVGVLVWLFSFELGGRIYFEMAMLHGSLELVFLLPRMMRLR